METVLTPPVVQAPPSARQQRLDDLLKQVPADLQAKVKSAYTSRQFDNDTPQLKSLLDSIPATDGVKHELWDTYWQFEPPNKPTPAQPVEAKPSDYIKGMIPAARDILKESVSVGGTPAIETPFGSAQAGTLTPPAIPALPKPPAIPMDAARGTATPNTPPALGELPKPQIALPALPSTGTKKIAGTYGNALVLDDGSQITQSPKNLKTYHDDGYPELNQSDLLKLQRGESLEPKGLVDRGTIKNIYDRPVLKNPDGSVSTTSSMSFEENGKEVLIPTVVDGKRFGAAKVADIPADELANIKAELARRHMPASTENVLRVDGEHQAIDHYRKTGEHLGKFDNPANADLFAQNLHESQAQRMGLPQETVLPPFKALPNETPDQLAQRISGQESGATARLKPPPTPVPPASGWQELGNQLWSRTAHMAAGAVRDLTFGRFDPETGTIHLPPTVDESGMDTGQTTPQLSGGTIKVLPAANELLAAHGIPADDAPLPTWINRLDKTGQVSASLLAAAVPWGGVSRALAPVFGIEAAGVGSTIMQRLEHTLGTSFVAGMAYPPAEGESKTEEVAKTMAGAVLFHTAAEALVGAAKAGVAAKDFWKWQPFQDLKDDLAELLYKRGKAETPESADKLAADIVNSEIQKAGGWDKVSRKTAKDSRAAVKDALANEPPAKPALETAGEAPPETVPHVTPSPEAAPGGGLTVGGTPVAPSLERPAGGWEPPAVVVPPQPPAATPIEPEVIPPSDKVKDPGLSDRWHVDRDLSMDNAYWLDGDDEESATAGIVPNEPFHGGYNVEFKDGRTIGPFDTIQKAAAAAERVLPQKNVTPPTIAGPRAGAELPPASGPTKERPSYTHNGKTVVGTHKGQIALEDGSTVDRDASFHKTLGENGYGELSDEDMANLATKASETPKPVEAPPKAPPETPQGTAEFLVDNTPVTVDTHGDQVEITLRAESSEAGRRAAQQIAWKALVQSGLSREDYRPSPVVITKGNFIPGQGADRTPEHTFTFDKVKTEESATPPIVPSPTDANAGLYKHAIGDMVKFKGIGGKVIEGRIRYLGNAGNYDVTWKEGGRNKSATVSDNQILESAAETATPPVVQPPTTASGELKWETSDIDYSDEKGNYHSLDVEAYGNKIVYKSPKGQYQGKWVVAEPSGGITDGPFKDQKAAKAFVEKQAGGASTATIPPPVSGPGAGPRVGPQAPPPEAEKPPIGGPHIPPPPEPETGSGFGKKNKHFTEDDANAARERLRDKFKRQMNAGFDPEMLADMFKLGAYYFEAGVREFAGWAERMIGDIGEGIRPYLQNQFDMIQQWFRDNPEALGEEQNVETTGKRTDEGAAGESMGEPAGGPTTAVGGGKVGAGESGERPSGPVSGGGAAKPGAKGPTERKQPPQPRFTLVGKEPVDLTPARRREINAKAEQIAKDKNVGDPLTPEEQDILRQYTGYGGLGTEDEGVLFQHYTSYRMVQWGWDRIIALGYPLDGASFLDPATGIGNYIGFAPADLNITGVEIDPVAGKIAQLLYPHAKIEIKPFENFISRQKYDIVQTNVPFHRSRGALRYEKDAEAYKDVEQLHDFFFVKGLDLAKPNGLVVFLTSTGTMDKLNPDIRQRINEQGEFLGAYRTPAGEFKKNTQYGGSVDAIILRKRTPEEIEAIQAVKHVAGGKVPNSLDGPGSGAWITSEETDKFSKPDQPPARLNNYYVEHPDKMWGQPEAGYGVRQVTRIGVRPTKPIEEFMAKSLTDDIHWEPKETAPTLAAEEEKVSPVGKAPAGAKHGTLIYDGKTKQLVYAHSDGNTYPAFAKGLAPKTEARVLNAVRMMGLADNLYDALRGNDIKEADKIRPQLRQAIQNYMTQYGKPPGYDPYLWRFINGGTEGMILPFEDHRRWMLAGLTNDKGELASIFTTNTIFKPPVVERSYDAKDITDVAKFVYEETGELNKDRIAELYKGGGSQTPDEMLAGKPGFNISSLTPDGKPTVDIGDEYLYGPIWPKIDQTEGMIQMVEANPKPFPADMLPTLQAQLDSLQAALPEQATLETLPADPFASYMDQGTIMHWLNSIGMRGELSKDDATGRYKWSIDYRGPHVPLKLNVELNPKTGERGDVDFPPSDIRQFMNHDRAMKSVPTGETDARGRPKYKQIFDVDEQRKLDQVVDSFKGWFKATPERVQHLVPAYNRAYRSTRLRTLNGKERNVEGITAVFKGAPLVTKSHQWEGADMMLHMRSGIIAHGVGGGKTMTATILAQLAKQRGMIKKLSLIVPAKVIKNWGYEINQLFPKAVIIDTSNMNSKNRNKTLHRIAASNPDFILMTYEGMKEIPLRASEDYMEEDIREVEERLRSAQSAGTVDKKTESQLQDRLRKLREKMAKIQDMKKTNAIFFEDTGIDSLIIDEAHNYKNAPVQYMDMSAWLHAASYADRAADMLYKTRYIHERKGGRAGQNVWGLTATPTPNNPIEIYSMLKYVAPGEWRDRNILNGGDFVEQFGIVGQHEEPSTTGVPKVRTVFLGYKNMNDLRAIIRRYVDLRPTKSFAEIKRPDVQYVEHMIDPTKEVIFEAARIAELQAWVTEHYRKAALHGWNPLSVLTLARKLAADLAIYNPIKYGATMGSPGSKLESVIQQLKGSEQGDNTQLVFVDLYRATIKVPVGSEEERLVQKFIAAGDLAKLGNMDVEDDASDLVTGAVEYDDEKKSDEALPEPVDPNAPAARMKTYEIINIHKAIRDAMIKAGIPEDQIAIINGSSNNSAAKKFKIQQANADGKIRFLIGTTQSMGEGMNLQANTTDIHHYDVPWNPAALEQREGRGVRQGNKQEMVRVHRYVGRGTSDAKMYAIIARKAQWYETIWYGTEDQVLDFDQDARNYSDIAQDAQIDQSTLDYWQTARRITVNTEKLAEFEKGGLSDAQKMLDKVKKDIAEREEKIHNYEEMVRKGNGTENIHRLIEQHRSAVENLKQEVEKREKALAETEGTVNALRRELTKDKLTLRDLVASMKAKGMPVLPEHEALANEVADEAVAKTGGTGTGAGLMDGGVPGEMPKPPSGGELSEFSAGHDTPPAVKGPPTQPEDAKTTRMREKLSAGEFVIANDTGIKISDVGGKFRVDEHAHGLSRGATWKSPLLSTREAAVSVAMQRFGVGGAERHGEADAYSAYIPAQNTAPPPAVANGKTYAPVQVKAAKADSVEKVWGYEVAPGLAATPSMNNEGDYTITHTVSGLNLGVHGTLDRMLAMANRMAQLGDWTRAADQLSADHTLLAGIRKIRGETGSVKIFRRQPPPPIQASLLKLHPHDSDMAEMESIPAPTGNVWQQMKAFPGEVYKHIAPGIYNSDIKMWPIFAERIRRAQEMASDAAKRTTDRIELVLHGLHPVEYDAFRMIVFWEDVYETAVQGDPIRLQQAVNGKTPLDRIDDRINYLRGVSTPAVLDAVDRHHQWMEEIFNDLVARDKAEPGQGRTKYFPNMVLRFGDGMGRIPGLPMRMRNPRRMYLKEREGHVDLHDADYIRVMEQYGARVYLHNMIDDFMQSVAKEYDLLAAGTSLGPGSSRNSELPQLTVQELQQAEQWMNTKGKPDAVYTTPNGVRFKVFQYNPGRVYHPVRAVKNDVIQDAIDAGVDELAIDIDQLRQTLLQSLPVGMPLPPSPQLTSPEPPLMTENQDDLTTPAIALGKQHKLYLLPLEVTEKLKRFREVSQLDPVLELMRAATRVFKTSVLMWNFAGWQGQNMFSDELGLYTESFDALFRQKEALDLLRGKLTAPQYQRLVELLHDARIYNASFVGSSSGVPAALNSPALRQYRAQSATVLQKLNPFGANVIGDFMRALNGGMQTREAIAKVALFLENYDRIQKGLPVKVTGISLGGLDPRSLLAVGRAARELNVDYGATAPIMRFVQGTVFPFIPFYLKVLPQVLRAMKHKGAFMPGDEFLAKIVSLFVAAWLVNHLIFPEQEKNNPDWVKWGLHVNLPFTDRYGHPYYWAMQTQEDVAAQWFGLHTLGANLDRVMNNKSTIEEAAKRQLEDMIGHQDRNVAPTAPGAMLERLYNPLVKAFVDVTANRDSFTGQEIVSKDKPNLWGDLSKAYPDNPYGRKLMMEYVAKKLITPYSQFLTAENMKDSDNPYWNWVTETGPASFMKLFGIHTVNPDAQARSEWFKKMDFEDSLKASKALQIRALSLANDNGDIHQDEFDRRVKEINAQPGAEVTGGDLAKMQSAPAYQRDKLMQQLKTVTDPAERQDIIRKISQWNEMFDTNRFFKLPVDLMNRIGPPPSPTVPSSSIPEVLAPPPALPTPPTP